jgi:hypothetical protein
MNDSTRVYFGHHKCASQYIKRVMVQSARLMGWATKVDRIPFVLPLDYHLREHYAQVLNRKREMLASDKLDLICLENADNEAVGILEKYREYKGFHVIRDPRDIVVSGYFSHLYSHPVSPEQSAWLWEYRRHLKSLDDTEQGLLAEIQFCASYFERLRVWNYENPRVLELRYEDLIVQPERCFARIFHFLDIPTPSMAPITTISMFLQYLLNKQFGIRIARRTRLPASVLRALLRHNSFQRRSGGRRPGEEETRHHYRKGIAGDWKNYFSARVKDAFKERYEGLVVQLGYAEDEAW